MYTTKENELLMTWSNFDSKGHYCVAIAKSDNGKVNGNWIQRDTLLFSKEMGDGYDGGHGMIFKDTDGKLYICLHSPNVPNDKTRERTVLLPITEENGTLVIKK